jgi:SseB protein N-terminal domain
VLVPVQPGVPPTARPGDTDFGWLTDTLDGQPFIVVFTSEERLRDHVGEGAETISVKFVQLIRQWPDEQWSFSVNPGSPVGAKLPGAQIVALANWADEVGLSAESAADGGAEEAATPSSSGGSAARAGAAPGPMIMQKVIPPAHVDFYLERGYDRVSGFVHRAAELAHLRTPAALFNALGLNYSGSPFTSDASEVHVLRWAMHRPNLYRIPYGGQHEAGMRAMQGWVIERSPFRGNGFAPGDSGDIIAEFKVDSARLPHGAQLWRISATSVEALLATFDADEQQWRRVEWESS